MKVLLHCNLQIINTIEPRTCRLVCALGRIRTCNNGSEDRCDIHFTTRAFVPSNLDRLRPTEHNPTPPILEQLEEITKSY